MSTFKTSAWLARLITFVLLMSLIPLGSVSAQAPVIPSLLTSIGCDADEFVQPVGNTFQCQRSGKPFKFIGVNIRELAYIDTILLPNNQYNNWDTEVTEQLTAAQFMGVTVIRIYISKHDKTPDQAGAALQRLLDKASIVAPKIKFLVTLTDFLQASRYYVKGDDGCLGVDTTGSTGYYACQVPGPNYDAIKDRYNDRGGLLESGWFGNGYEQNYKPFVGSIVSRFKNDTRIFAWQLGNELQVGTESWPPHQNLVTFTTAMSSYIKQTLGAQQMVTTGFKFLNNAVSETLTPIDTQYSLSNLMNDIYGNPNIAFGSFHSYDLDWSREDMRLEYTWYLSHNKPYIVGELGYSGGACNVSLPDRYWDDVLIPSSVVGTQFDRSRALLPTIQQYIERYGASGVMQWGFVAGTFNGSNDDCKGMDINATQPGRDWLPLFSMYRCLALDLARNLPQIGRNCTAQHVDTALIIDSSGSMTTNDPANRRLDAARTYLTASLNDDFVGVVDFDSSVRTWSPVVRVGPNRANLDTAIGRIDSSGGTNIGLGLQQGCNDLIGATTAQDPSPNVHKAAILLTDGLGSLLEQQLCFTIRGWPVYTFGFGDANDAQLQTIANATGGEYKRLTTENLACEFQQVRAKIGRGTITPCVTTQVNPGATTTITQNVPSGQDRATFSASYPSNTSIAMSLTTPSGRAINRSTTTPDVLHSQGATFESFSIAQPEAGAWRIDLFGENVSSASVQVVFSASTLPAPTNAIPIAEAGGPYLVTTGQPVTFDASGSRDPDGTIARYQWDVNGDGTFDATTTIPTLVHTYTTIGTPTLRVMVTDNDGRVASDTAMVTVEAPGPPLDVYARSADRTLNRISYRNGGWDAWQSIGDLTGADGSQPAVLAGPNGQLDVFVRTIKNIMRHRTFVNGVWQPWENLGGVLYSDPVAISRGVGKIDVYARSEGFDLYRLRFRNGAWGTWEFVTGMAGDEGSQPSVVQGPNTQLDVFFRAGDNTLRHRTYYNDVWTAYNIGSNIASDPVAIAGSNGQIDVYVRNTNMELQRLTYRSGVWGPWEVIGSLPGNALSQPVVSNGPDGQIDVFVRGSDNALYQRTYRNGTWRPWQNLGGTLDSDPTVVTPQ